MTNVKISRSPNGIYSVLVDGDEMNTKILAEGFHVELSEDPQQPARVHMIVAADVLEIDLPDVVLSAIRAEADNA